MYCQLLLKFLSVMKKVPNVSSRKGLQWGIMLWELLRVHVNTAQTLQSDLTKLHPCHSNHYRFCCRSTPIAPFSTKPTKTARWITTCTCYRAHSIHINFFNIQCFINNSINDSHSNITSQKLSLLFSPQYLFEYSQIQIHRLLIFLPQESQAELISLDVLPISNPEAMPSTHHSWFRQAGVHFMTNEASKTLQAIPVVM